MIGDPGDGARRIRHRSLRMEGQRLWERRKPHQQRTAISDGARRHPERRVGFGYDISHGLTRIIERHKKTRMGFGNHRLEALVGLPRTHHQVCAVGSDQGAAHFVERAAEIRITEHVGQIGPRGEAHLPAELPGEARHDGVAPVCEAAGEADRRKNHVRRGAPGSASGRGGCSPAFGSMTAISTASICAETPCSQYKRTSR